MSMSQIDNLSRLKAEDFEKEIDGKKTALYILKNKKGHDLTVYRQMAARPSKVTSIRIISYGPVLNNFLF